MVIISNNITHLRSQANKLNILNAKIYNNWINSNYWIVSDYQYLV